MIPRNTTQHQRDTFVCWRTVIFSRWLHAKACTWRQFKLKIPRRMYRICTKFNQTRWILISWWKMKSGCRGFSVGMQAAHPWQISTRTNISTLFILVLCVAVFPPSSNALAMLRPSRCTPLWGDQDTWKRCKRVVQRIEYTGEVFILKINCSSFAVHDLSLSLFLSLSLSSFLPPCSIHTTRPINIKSYYLSWKTEIVGLIIVVSSMFCNLATTRPPFFIFFLLSFLKFAQFPFLLSRSSNIDRSLSFSFLSWGLLSLSGLTLPIFSPHLLSSLPLSRAISLTLRKTSKTRR